MNDNENKIMTRSQKRKREEELKKQKNKNIIFTVKKKNRVKFVDDSGSDSEDSEYVPEIEDNDLIEEEDDIDEVEYDNSEEEEDDLEEEDDSEEEDDDDFDEYSDKDELIKKILVNSLARKLGNKILDNVFKKLKDNKDYDEDYEEEDDEGEDDEGEKKETETINEEYNEKEKILRKIKIRSNYDTYFKMLSLNEQKKILQIEKEISDFYKMIVPVRYKVLNMETTISNKSLILNKVNTFENMHKSDNEYHKLSKWINGISMIPFGKHVELPIKSSENLANINKFLNESYGVLDRELYGQYNAKNKLMQIISQWISNPKSQTTILALEGPPGVGKTSLIKLGVSKALHRPFSFIALGGTNDSCTMEGHSYTYEGAIWGRIVSILMETQCMNPIIFFDELDKISTSEKGKEIVGILTHLTDPVQNVSFNDKYFDGINLNLSKAFIVFSYNNPNLINPVLKDRLTVIKFDTYKIDEKIIIAQKYIIPKLLENVGFKDSDVIFEDETLKYIINKYASKEKGVRNMKRCIEDILMKINLIRFVKKDDSNIKFPYDIKKIDTTFPICMSNEIADELLKCSFKKNELPISIRGMYL